MLMSLPEMRDRSVSLEYRHAHNRVEIIKAVPRGLLYDSELQAWVLHVYDMAACRDRALTMDKVQWS